MSNQVYSFRLNDSHDIEAAAIRVLEELRAKGWEIREIMTEGLLRIGESSLDDFHPPVDRAMQRAVERGLDNRLGAIIDAIESRLDSLARIAPGNERRRAMTEVARTSLGASIANTLEVRDWEND